MCTKCGRKLEKFLGANPSELEFESYELTIIFGFGNAPGAKSGFELLEFFVQLCFVAGNDAFQGFRWRGGW